MFSMGGPSSDFSIFRFCWFRDTKKGRVSWLWPIASITATWLYDSMTCYDWFVCGFLSFWYLFSVLLWCPVCKRVVYNVLDDPCSWPRLCFVCLHFLLVEVGRIGWRKRYTLCFACFYLILSAFANFLSWFGSSNSCIRLFLVVLRSWLPFHPFANHPYDCHDCLVPYVYAISLFCFDFCLIFALVLSDIRQLVDLLCSTVPFALVCCANTLFDMMRLE